MKIVINKCYGGFDLSAKAEKEYCKQKGIDSADFVRWEVKRNDPFLVDIVEKMGKEAGGNYSELKIVNIPDDVDWTLEEYDGIEWVAERHRTWG